MILKTQGMGYFKALSSYQCVLVLMMLIYFDANCIFRHISIYSHVPALSKRSPRPHDLETHASMEYLESQHLPSLMWPLR